MKANELRIGNLLNFHGESRHVTGYEIHQLNNGACFDEHPIKLTDDWILKLNFYKCKGGFDEWFGYGNGFFKIKIIDGDYIFFNGKEELRPIEYVHQLQNLYFALTGKELESK